MSGEQVSADASVSLQLRADRISRGGRKQTYEQMTKELEEGEMILALCKLEGSEDPVQIIISNLETYNWTMNQLSKPWSELTDVLFLVVTMDWSTV